MRSTVMRIRICALLLALAMGGAAVAEATVIVPADLRKLASTAKAIAHGRVAEVRSQWAAGNGQRIETLVVVDVDGYLKGNLGGRVVFRVPGGKMGYLRSVTVGAPVLREGDEVVVFLTANGPSIPHIVGFNQGLFRVSVDRASGRRTVASPVLSANANANVRGSQPLVRGSKARKAIALAEFERQVRTIVEQQDRANVARPRRR